MALTILAASVAILAGGAPPSAVVSQVSIQPLPLYWYGPRPPAKTPAVARYGERLLTGQAERATALRARIALTDVADETFACRGWYENRSRAPRLDLKCSDGSRIAMTFEQPTQGRGFGVGEANGLPFRFRFGPDLATR
jgi:hypothetical protein